MKKEKTITLIGILNKKAKGEQVPDRIRYNGYEWVWNVRWQDYQIDGMEEYLFGGDFFNKDNYNLNEEVSICNEYYVNDIEDAIKDLDKLWYDHELGKDECKVTNAIQILKQYIRDIEEWENTPSAH